MPEVRRESGRLGWFKRLLGSPEELDDLLAESTAVAAGCDTACNVTSRQLVRIRGVLQSVTIVPATTNNWLEAHLWDGSGRGVKLMWIGRSQIPGITAGVTLYVSGRVTESKGKLVIYNPRYEIVAAKRP